MSIISGKFMDSLPVILITADLAEDKIIYFNQEAKNLFSNISKGGSFKQILKINKGFENYLNERYEYGKKFSCGHRVNDIWLILNACFDDENKGVIVLTAIDITSFVIEGYFEPGRTRDEFLGIYDRQSGINFLDNYAVGLEEGTKPTFTISYIRLDCAHVNGYGSLKEYRRGFADVVSSAIRITDIFAFMGESDFMVLFPKCSFEVVSNIMTTIENKLEIINATEDVSYEIKIEYAILEANLDKIADGETLIARVVNLL